MVYEQLYESDQGVAFTLCNTDGNRKLLESEKQELEEPILESELLYSVKSMSPGKTPGSDGLTPAFYIKFWNLLAAPLSKAFNLAYDKRKLHISARRGILNLIPKKDKDPLYIKNWRPITLLNTDYKILAKVLANRMKKFLDKLVSKDQTGFMQGRNIATNIRKIIDIDEYCTQNNISACILSVDFEKCFNTIEIKSIDNILDYYGFGIKYRTWVTLLFSDMLICTLNNGYSSEYFTPTRGLFQGNPIASYLYLLTGQVLNDLIMKNAKVRGIDMGGKELKMIQFADDLNMPLLFEQQVLDETLNELRLFKNQVGLQISLSKSCIYQIGRAKNTAIKLESQGIPWTDDLIKVLGIDISNTQDMQKINIDPLLDRMQGVTNTWKTRDLGLVGKVLVINSLLMSLLVYRLVVLPKLSKDYIDKIN